MSAFTEMFGTTLLSAKGKEEVKTTDALSGKKCVGIYFSAHWCPPCRGFTPKLAQWYTDDLKAKGMEIVFVSSDQDDSAFKEYFAEQPWLALPYTEEGKQLKTKLSKTFKVQGIPSFVVLDGETGELVTVNGREAVSSDPKGEEMPWKPQPLIEILKGTKFLKREGEDKEENKAKASTVSGTKEVEFNDEFLSDKAAIGLYFSAHWCPPCKQFTPIFGEVYKKVNDKLAKEDSKKKFEVLFLSCDRSDEQFNEYFSTMPWMALPLSEKKKNSQLSDHFDVSGIPALVILNVVQKKDGSGYDLEVANKNAVGAVSDDEETGEKFPWLPEPVKEIDGNPEGIDEGLSLICLFEGEKDEKKKQEYMSILKEASKTRQSIGDNDDALNFFCASKSGRLADRVRSECGVEKKDDKNVQLIMMDIGSEEYYAWPADKEFSKENLEEFFLNYEKDLLEAKPMGA